MSLKHEPASEPMHISVNTLVYYGQLAAVRPQSENACFDARKSPGLGVEVLIFVVRDLFHGVDSF